MNTHSKTLPKRGYVRGYVYFCANNTRNRTCSGTSLVREQIETRVRAWLKKLADEISERAEAVDAAPVPMPKRAESVADRQALLEQQARIEDAIADLTVKLGTKVISERAYKVACSKLEAEADQIEHDLENVHLTAVQPSTPKRPLEKPVRDLAAWWPALRADERNHLLRQLVERIVVTKTGHNQAIIEVATAWGTTEPI